MFFALENAVPIRRREDGLLEKDTFDISTAVPTKDIPQIGEGKPRYSKPLSDQDRARALYELSEREAGRELPITKKVEWTLTSDKARDVVTAFENTLLTGGMYPAVQGIRGALDGNGDYNMFDRLWRGIVNPEDTARLTDKIAVENEPTWAKITRSVAEDVLAYGAVGIVGAKAKTTLFARDIARRVEQAADDFVATKIGAAPAEEGVLTGTQARMVGSIDDMKDGFIRAQMSKLGALEVSATGNVKTSASVLYERRSMINLILSELDNLTIRPQGVGANIANVKIGQKVSFTEGGKSLVGTITELVGKRATIDMEGRQVVAMLSQLSVPIPEEVKPKEPTTVNMPRPEDFDTLEAYVASKGIEYVDIEALPRRGVGTTRDYYEKITSSMKKDGVLRPIIIDQDGRVWDGIHRIAYARELGIKNIPAIKIDSTKIGEEDLDALIDKIAKDKTIPQLTAEWEAAQKAKAPTEPPTPTKPTAVSPGPEEPDLPEDIEKSILEKGVESLFSIKLKPSEVKAIVRQQTGQTENSKELLNYLKEKYSNEIKSGEIEAEVEQKLSTPLKASAVKGIVKQATGQVKEGESITITDRQALRETLKAQVRAASGAERATREQIFDIQSNMIKVIDESELELEDKARFIKTIKNANSPIDFERLLPQVEERIAVLEQKSEKRALVSQIKKLADKAESDAISIEYREAIQDLLKGFDLKGRSKDTIRKLEATKAYIDRKLAAGEGVEMPADVINRLNILSKKRLDDITNEELKGLLGSVETLEKVGRTKQALKEQAYDKKKMVIKSNLVDDVKAINTKPIPETPIGDTPNKMAERYIKFLNYLSKTRVGLTPIEGLADITGMRRMKDVLDKNFSSYLTFNDKIMNDWYELTKDFNQGNFDRIGVYAIAQQEGGIVKLQSSGITQAQIDAVVLTPEEQSAYDFVRSTFDSYYPEIKKYSRDVYNQDVGKVDNYVSFMSDTNAMNELEMYDRFSGKTEEAVAKRMTKTVEKGFLESRATGAQYAIEKNIDKIFRRHMDDVAYMLTMGRDVKMYYEIVNSKEMRESLGDLGALAWLQYLDLLARKGGSDGAKRIAAIDILRRNMGAGILGFRLSSALVQLSAFGDAMATMGAEWATRGATSIATSAEWRNFIMDNFPEVRKAVGDDIAFREFGEDMFGKVQRAGMMPLQFMDGLMRSSATAGAYQKIAQERGVVVDLTKPDAEIILEATKLMRQSQGSSFFKDQPLSITTDFGLADNKSINKMLLTFQSFMLGRWDNINRQIWRLGIEKKDYKKAISSLFWLLTFGFALEETLRRGGRKIINLGRKKRDIREEEPFVQDVAFNALQSIPLAGQLASSILYSSNPVPMLNTADSVFGGLGQIYKGKETSTKIKGAIRSVGGLGALGGVPGVSQAAQIVSDRIPKKKKIQLRD